MPEGSILTDTKMMLGVGAAESPFDPEITLHINSALANMYQLGVGPSTGLFITNEDTTWDDLLEGDPRLGHVKSLMMLKVKMLFDPPDTGYMVTAYEKVIEKYEWQVRVAAEEINDPITLDDDGPDLEVLDGGVV